MFDTAVIEKMREYFDGGATKNVGFRINALKALRVAIKGSEERIYEALNADLSKHRFEAYATEIGIVLHEITYALKHIRKWMRPKRVRTPLMHFPASSRIYSEPYGVALIMSPWNYPFQLTLAPLVGAIAAGNCALIKPSNYSPNTSAVIEKIISETFAPEYVKVLTGGREVNKSLFEQRFDYLFFTGSVAVGRRAMEAAAKHLTPVTLELGGKSPCIVDESADIDLAAKRIVWGKFVNAGQTCVAPDYVYVHSSVAARFTDSLRKYIVKFFGENAHKSPDFPKIINEKHFERLSGLLRSGTLAFGGKLNKEENKISPTILTGVTWDDPVMGEEIFGPVLPVMEYGGIAGVISKIKSMPKPLALYLFSRSKKTQSHILTSISFGGGCINDTVVHLATPYMPFGGAGDSGMGGYHGKNSFDTFSHKKSILRKSNALDINLRYPPYKSSEKIVKFFMK